MNKKQLLSRTLAAPALASKTLAAFFVIALFFSSSTVFAQVKIGTNPTTIDPANNLEVEATNNKKVAVHKADGTVVIENTPSGAITDSIMTVDNVGNVRMVNRLSLSSIQYFDTPIANALTDGDSDGITGGLTSSTLNVNPAISAVVTPTTPGGGYLGKKYVIDFSNVVPPNAKGIILSFLLDHGSSTTAGTTEFRNKGIAVIRGWGVSTNASIPNLTTDTNIFPIALTSDKKVTFDFVTSGVYFFVSMSITGYTL